MLLGYGAKNCWCFKDWMQVNLELDGSVPSDISLNLPAATAMCFKGANASGKTNGLKVLAFIKHFAEFSFQTKPDGAVQKEMGSPNYFKFTRELKSAKI